MPKVKIGIRVRPQALICFGLKGFEIILACSWVLTSGARSGVTMAITVHMVLIIYIPTSEYPMNLQKKTCAEIMRSYLQVRGSL